MRRAISLPILLSLILPALLLPAGRAWANAPIISQMPNPAVGNQATSGPLGSSPRYVYPDAFDLHTQAYDDNTPSNYLTWSYEIAGTPKYAINGVKPINSTDDNRINPPADSIINRAMNTLPGADDVNPDQTTNTITIRNINLYPYGGTPSMDMSPEAQDSNNHIQPVTFWCSDGSLATSSTVLFYTDNTYTTTTGLPTGSNRLSGFVRPRPGKRISWFGDWKIYDTFNDHTTTSTWTDGQGFCFNVTPEGNNLGSIQSPISLITLTDNMVYRIRLTMNCSQLTPGKTPFWDFILENWNGNPASGLNLYGLDSFYLDNTGGANAIVNTTAGAEVTILWAPAAFQTQQWRNTTTGLFAANPGPPTGNGIDYHLQKDAALRFRVMDVDANAALLNNQKYGAICLKEVIIETVPFSRRVYQTGPNAFEPTPDIYSATALKSVHNNPNDPVPGNVMAASLLGSSVNTTSGALTITPVGDARLNEIVQVTPATDTKYIWGDWPAIADDWPIPWESNRMYELKVELSAPSVTAAAHPFDVLWMNMEPPTNEVITESYVTANHALATPRAGAPQAYYMYYYSGKETKSAIAALHFLRWRLRFGNSESLDWPNPSDAMNAGAVRIHSVRVNKVEFH